MTTAPRSAHAPSVHRLWRAGVAALAAMGVAAALAGCGSTPGSRSSGDPAAAPQQSGSGVTVFGDIDVNVTKQRTR
jgi:hypothetical protein